MIKINLTNLYSKNLIKKEKVAYTKMLFEGFEPDTLYTMNQSLFQNITDVTDITNILLGLLNK